MKKILLSVILFAILALPAIELANGAEPPDTPITEICCGPGTVLNRLTNWMFVILMVVAVIYIIMAAFNFVTAAGDPEKVTKARNFVLYALIGVLVAFAAKGLINLISKIATGS
jgi:hypothetical protein